MRPLLTIAIPTYNRASCLSLLLENLAPQLPGHPEIELIISDNASPDRTQEVVQQFQDAGLAARYIKNSANIGPDANILQCFTLATGRYVWICGDDDVIVPGALSRIVELLRGEEYSLVYLASYSFCDSFVPPKELPAKLSITTYLWAEALARREHIFFTFISGNIVNKELLDLSKVASSELLDTHLVQLAWIYAALERHVKSVFVRDPLVATKVGNTGNYGLCQTFEPNLHRITMDRLSSPSIRRLVLNSSIQNLLPIFLYKSRFGTNPFSSESPHSILKAVFGGNYRYWLFVYPVIRLPIPLAGLWMLVNRVLNRLDRTLGLPILA